ncbi:MAG: hypothetical protein N2C13_05850 [Chloroflexota bacterium]
MAEKKEMKHKDFLEHIPEDVIEHARAAKAEVRKGFETILPPGFLDHRRAARKEMLLAARGMIDYAIERLEARGKA